MAGMTMKTPEGNTVQTRSKRVYAVVSDGTNPRTGKRVGVVLLRTDNFETAVKRVQKEQRWGFISGCFIYNTVRKTRSL